MKILVINGPNLNMLGKRETSVYGSNTLEYLENLLIEYGKEKNIEVECFQSNFEGGIVEKIHSTDANAIVINAGAYTHTSIAIRDSILSVSKPFIEVHISNVFSREPFRHHSYLSDIAKAVITGLGFDGYKYAIDFFIKNQSS